MVKDCAGCGTGTRSCAAARSRRRVHEGEADQRMMMGVVSQCFVGGIDVGCGMPGGGGRYGCRRGMRMRVKARSEDIFGCWANEEKGEERYENNHVRKKQIIS